jgi:FlaA1/EpsC-like NDP-sugar epimerase
MSVIPTAALVPISANARAAIEGTVTLVTGAGGSIGSALTKKILSLGPRKLILLELSEHEFYHLDLALGLRELGSTVVPVLGDVRDESLLNEVFEEQRPELVFHTAACKHVALLEQQLRAALSTNLTGTYLVAQAAMRYGARRVVTLSTDKAVNPTSVMGVSKRLAELALAQLTSEQTAFVSVRFGNVIGSRGSVVPLFQEQISRHEPVTVTDPEVARYFLSIDEAVRIIVEMAWLGIGSNVYVPDFARSVKITDIAECLIREAGLSPGIDIPIVFTGLRAGEKMYEELTFPGETLVPTDCDGIRRVTASPAIGPPLAQWVPGIEELLRRREYALLLEMICELVPEYRPSAAVLKQIRLGF